MPLGNQPSETVDSTCFPGFYIDKVSHAYNEIKMTSLLQTCAIHKKILSCYSCCLHELLYLHVTSAYRCILCT